MDIKTGKKYLVVYPKSKPFTIIVTGSPNTFINLIRVMSPESKIEWYERKHLLQKIETKRKKTKKPQ